MRRSLAAVVAALAAGPATAQIDPSLFNLEVVPVLRTYADNGDGTLSAADAPSGLMVRVGGSDGAKRVRVELRYRITVTGSTTGSYTSGASTFSSGGLASTSMNVRFSANAVSSGLSTGATGATLQTAPIGANLGNTGTGFANPDPGIDPGSGFGLYAPWRTGVVPADPSFSGNNVVLTPNTLITNILPLATAAPDQRSDGPANGGVSGPNRFWTLYAFDILIPRNYVSGNATDTQVVTIAVPRGVSNGTPAPFLFFPRVGGANESTAIEGGGGWTGGSVTLSIRVFVPAPASPVALVVGAGWALRRRR